MCPGRPEIIKASAGDWVEHDELLSHSIWRLAFCSVPVLGKLGHYPGGTMHDKSVELLNKTVADELFAVHQYMYFHFHCDDQGYDLLASLLKQTAIEEMLHTERLAERILFLKANVEMGASAAVAQIRDVAEMLKRAREPWSCSSTPRIGVQSVRRKPALFGTPMRTSSKPALS